MSFILASLRVVKRVLARYAVTGKYTLLFPCTIQTFLTDSKFHYAHFWQDTNNYANILLSWLYNMLLYAFQNRKNKIAYIRSDHVTNVFTIKKSSPHQQYLTNN